jgi:sugar lactone lactonase YvrE
MGISFVALKTIRQAGRENGNFATPAAVSFDRTGQLLVGDSGDGQVHLLAPGGTLLRSWRHRGFTPSAMSAAADGSIWACDLHAGRAVRFTPTGEPVGSIGDLDPFSRPAGIVTLPDGRVAVADTGASSIRVHAPDGRLDTVLRGPHSRPLQHPHGLAADRNGTLIAADRGNRRLVRFGPEWDYPEEIDLHLAPGSPARPWGVAFDRAGRIAVSLTECNRVLLLSPTGDLLGALGGEGSATGPLLWPTALAFGPGDLLAIADTYNSRVVLAKAS